MTDEELIARLREGAAWDDDIVAAGRIEALKAEVAKLRGALVIAREWVDGCTRTGINQDLAEADLATIDAALRAIGGE